MARSGDDHLARFYGLAQYFQHFAWVLGQFIEEKHAAMSKADFAGARATTAADKRSGRGGVMWVAKWALKLQWLANDRLDNGDFATLLLCWGREDTGQPAC